MAVQFVVFMIVVPLIDRGILQQLNYIVMCAVKRSTYINYPNDVIDQDSGVVQESNRVNSTQIGKLKNSEKIILINFKKTFGTLKRIKAIEDISVGISKKEC